MDKYERLYEYMDEYSFADRKSMNRLIAAIVDCYWFDADMNGEGISDYMEYHSDQEIDNLLESLGIIGADSYAEIVSKYLSDQLNEDEINEIYQTSEPLLVDIMADFLDKNRSEICG